MVNICVHMFGRFQVRGAQVQLPGFDRRRVQELLAFLLLNRDRPHAREQLATLLCGDLPLAQAKKYLRQALWQLQTAIEAQVADQVILLVDADWLQLNPAAAVWSDIALLEQTFYAVQGIAGKDLSAEQAAAMKAAVQHYRGDLLEGWYQDWCLFHRERLQMMYLMLLDKLMGHCEYHHQYEEGIQFGTSILGFDRARERTHRRLMRLHYLAGDRTTALRQYARCAQALQEELGVAPARSTERLNVLIRKDDFAPEPLLAANGSTAKSEMSAHALERLVQVYDFLNQVQGQIGREIESAELSIKRQQSTAP